MVGSKPPRLGLTVAASSVGLTIESYDFVVFAYVAAILGELFFPSTPNPLAATLNAFLVFGAGFVMRPVGGFIFAHLGDKLGRKMAFIITLIIMGISMLGIGLSPTYSQVGILATILLVIFRLLQGLSYGGETGSATVFLQEHVPVERRGLWNGVLQIGFVIGPILALLTLLANALFLSHQALVSYGWRIPFFVGAVIVVIGIFMRFFVKETPVFTHYKEKGEVLDNPIVVSFRKLWKEILIIFIINSFEAAAFYAALVAPFSLIWLTYLKIPLMTTIISFIIIYVIVAVFMILFGYLSDKYGRRPLIRWDYLLFAILLLPLYSVFTITKNIAILTLVTLVPAILSEAILPPLTVFFAELMPANVRVSGFNIGYQLGAGVIGGFAPYISTYILLLTNSLLWAYAWVAVGALLIALIAWLWTPETKGWDYLRTIPKLAKK